MAQLLEKAYAKINLSLHITGQRADGYHTLDSLCVFAEAHDSISLSPGENTIEISGEFSSNLVADETNLVMRALSLFQQEQGETQQYNVHLQKRLPIASGIGGGSADAAAMLRLLNKKSRRPLSLDALNRLALRLGADVPMCIASEPCVVKGIGEVIRPVELFPKCWIVLINPLISISTPEVFKNLDHKSNPPMPAVNAGFESMDSLIDFLKRTRNDLQAAASYSVPEINIMHEAIASNESCLFSRMSGSGATVFGIFATKSAALSAQSDLRNRFKTYWVSASAVLSQSPTAATTATTSSA